VKLAPPKGDGLREKLPEEDIRRGDELREGGKRGDFCIKLPPEGDGLRVKLPLDERREKTKLPGGVIRRADDARLKLPLSDRM